MANRHYGPVERLVKIEKNIAIYRVLVLVAKKRYEKILLKMQSICCDKKILEDPLCLQWIGRVMQHSELVREYLLAKNEFEYATANYNKNITKKKNF